MPEECAVAFGLALFDTAEDRVDFGERFFWQDVPDEGNGRADIAYVGMEVTSGEAEDHAGIVIRQDDGVGNDPLVGISQGDEQRRGKIPA